jgi:hypothetical protein
MNEKALRQKIREVLHETMQQLHPAYPVNGGVNQFPYERGDDIVRLPEDISTKEEYVLNWEEVSENNDLYGFPMEEFVKGVYVEKAKRNNFNILDIAEIVINKLKENHQFYSNLGV